MPTGAGAIQTDVKEKGILRHRFSTKDRLLPREILIFSREIPTPKIARSDYILKSK